MAAQALEKLPLIVIAGPTASGKTALAIELAKKYNGEIISADSRTIYKHMDIGTAKPTINERQGVAHWGIDLVEPGQRYSAAQFKEYAIENIKAIRQRGHIPFLVGGTGLYIDSVIFDYQFRGEPNGELRDRLAALSVEELQEYCIKNNVMLPENRKNKRYLIRAIEQQGAAPISKKLADPSTIVVAILTDRETLRQRIIHRSKAMFVDNVVKEATEIGEKYGWNSESMTGNIYPLVNDYSNGRLSYEDMQAKAQTLDWRLAKRQLTWLRRNPVIRWGDIDDTREYLRQQLAKI